MFSQFFCGLYLRSILVLLALFGLAACGGGDGVSNSPSSSTPPSSSAVISSSSSSLTSSSEGSSSTSSSKSSSSTPAIPGLIGGAMQGKSLNLNSVVSTFAGVAKVRGADGLGVSASFERPNAIVRDGDNLYVADTSNNTIRRIVLVTGAVTTLAGTPGIKGSADGTGAAARFSSPSGITSDGTYLYVSDSGNNTIRKIVIATGAVSTVAGTVGVSGSADGVANVATFNYPAGIATDGTKLYVADVYSNKIRSIVIATGVVATFAGTGIASSADGVGVLAGFNAPNDITTDGNNLYVADTGNHSIRKIVIASGVATVFAGSASTPHGYGTDGGKDGIGALATFYYPSSITIDGAKLYVADTYSNTIRSIDVATGVVTTLAGKALIFSIVNQGATTIGSSDGIGEEARFSHPSGIATDGVNLYVSDTGNSIIRKIALANYAVTTLAGKVDVPNNISGAGTAVNFYIPAGITTDGTNLYVRDSIGIRKIAIATGAVTEFTGISLTSGSAHLTTDGTNLFVVDSDSHSILKIIIATGVSTRFAGGHRNCFDCISPFSGSANGVGDAANFFNPTGITTDGTNLYVSDTVNNTIRKIAIASGMVTTFAGTVGVAGSVDAIGTAAIFNNPKAITTDGVNLYIADTLNHTIRRIVLATGVVTTFAGTAGVSGAVDGAGALARFNKPDGITTDGTNLYVSDTANNTLRKIVIATGVVTTLAGAVEVPGNTDGTGSAARFDTPKGITTDGVSLYVTDSYSNTIRKIH